VTPVRASLLVAIAFVLFTAGAGAGPVVDARWTPLAHLLGAVDVAGPRPDGRFVVVGRDGLFLLRRSGALSRFAPAFRPSRGEAYIAIASNRSVPGAGCAFAKGDIYALEPLDAPGVTMIDRHGHPRRFLSLPAGSFASAIAFDTVGTFRNRLLVAAQSGTTTSLYAADCRGRLKLLSRQAIKVEGGIAVAPAASGPLRGRLVAADETTGSLYAFDAAGKAVVLSKPARLNVGQDLGVESIGFVPRGFRRGGIAVMTDLGAPGAPTAGTDSILSVPAAALLRRGVRAGDLLVATEASGVTVAVRCRPRCRVWRVAHALDATHAEGHIAFAPR